MSLQEPKTQWRTQEACYFIRKELRCTLPHRFFRTYPNGFISAIPYFLDTETYGKIIYFNPNKSAWLVGDKEYKLPERKSLFEKIRSILTQSQ